MCKNKLLSRCLTTKALRVLWVSEGLQQVALVALKVGA
jgi:hypothetical protein